MTQLSERITIPQFFAGKSIFITGGTGFIGKVLTEKLLRSCPECGPIYLLIRPKKGKNVKERLENILNDPLFERLKMEKPENISKINIVEGDTILDNLGLNACDRAALEKNVSIVFHAAASVHFNDSLKYALKVNVLGTHNVVRLALNMKNLKVFMHVSTTYCNPDKDIVDEIIYPPHGNWRDNLEMIDAIDDDILEVLSPKIIGPKLDNTYVYTKSLAEQMIKDYSSEIPVIIFRPSIVVPGYSDPIPGYVDNFNGPCGISVASGLGVLHCLLGEKDAQLDYIPIDLVIKSMLISTWLKGTENCTSENPTVYNCSGYDILNLTLRRLTDISANIYDQVCLNNGIWYPSTFVTSNTLVHYISIIFLHLLPALLVDTVLYLAQKKPRLIKVQRRIYLANLALKTFMLNEFRFLNKKFGKLRTQVLPEDLNDFALVDYIDDKDYVRIALSGGCKYLMHQEPGKDNTHNKRLYVLDRITRGVFFLLLYYFVVLPSWNLLYHTASSYF